MELAVHTDAPRAESVVTVNYRIAPTGTGDSRFPEADQIPHRVGRFYVLDKVARGGMGVVLHAYDADLDRELAIKLLAPGIPPESETGWRFAQEARVVSQLHHPGIIPVFEAGTLPDGRAYFAMPFVPGDTLADHLDRRPEPQRDLDRWLAVFDRVCRTMAHAHARGVVHRDLKPGNVMVARSGDVFVMDWGVSTFTHEDHDRTGTEPSGWVFGTPAYMAPEQARGRGEAADARCDVFGLGAVLCEILTGEPPYVGPNVATVTRLAADGDQSETARRLAGCRADPAIVRLCRCCLAPDAADRPADAAAVAAQFAAYLEKSQPTEAVLIDLRRERKWQRWAELVTAALALTASAAVGAAAHKLKGRAETYASPPAAVGLTPTESPPAVP
jgi:serine/threonine protein kinase